jgi:hypothetical protein
MHALASHLSPFSPARAVLDKRKNDLKTQKAREITNTICTATFAAPSIPAPALARKSRTASVPRGGGCVARAALPAAPLDAEKTKLPFDPVPLPPPPPQKATKPAQPTASVRMARQRTGGVPLAEGLEPSDVDLGKVGVRRGRWWWCWCLPV